MQDIVVEDTKVKIVIYLKVIKIGAIDYAIGHNDEKF